MPLHFAEFFFGCRPVLLFRLIVFAMFGVDSGLRRRFENKGRGERAVRKHLRLMVRNQLLNTTRLQNIVVGATQEMTYATSFLLMKMGPNRAFSYWRYTGAIAALVILWLVKIRSNLISTTSCVGSVRLLH
jgi:hypothetical protein